MRVRKIEGTLSNTLETVFDLDPFNQIWNRWISIYFCHAHFSVVSSDTRIFICSTHRSEKRKSSISSSAVSRKESFLINFRITHSLFNRLHEESIFPKLTCTSKRLLARPLQPRWTTVTSFVERKSGLSRAVDRSCEENHESVCQPLAKSCRNHKLWRIERNTRRRIPCRSQASRRAKYQTNLEE